MGPAPAGQSRVARGRARRAAPPPRPGAGRRRLVRRMGAAADPRRPPPPGHRAHARRGSRRGHRQGTRREHGQPLRAALPRAEGPAQAQRPVVRAMRSPIDVLLSDFIDAWNAGERPRVADYLARAEPAQRSELTARLEDWLMLAPIPAYDERARMEIRNDPVLQRAVAEIAADPGLWPEL